MDSENESLDAKYSYAFNIPGLRYHVKIYPNGDNEDHRGEIWMYFLTRVFGDRITAVDLKIVIESANVSKRLEDTFDDVVGTKICKMDELLDSECKYFVNGEITFKIKGTLTTYVSSRSVRLNILSEEWKTPISMHWKTNSISMQWKIKEANLKEVVKEESNGGSLCSDVKKDASFSEASYYLEFHVEKMNDENELKISINLHVDNQNMEVLFAVYDLSVETANFNDSFQSGSNKSFRIGTLLCSAKDLFDPSKGFIANGYLTLKFDGILMKDESDHSIELKCKNGFAPKSAIKEEHKDFMIVAGENEIQVHKQVLIEVSPVLSKMLESGTKEESIIENKMYITNFTFTTVDAAIKLCYGINVSMKYLLEEILSLYKFGHEYRIAIITDLIEECLIKEISPTNVVYFLKFSAADSYNVKKLYQKCIEFIMKCSKDSTPIFASESLDKKLLASLCLNTFAFKC